MNHAENIWCLWRLNTEFRQIVSPFRARKDFSGFSSCTAATGGLSAILDPLRRHNLAAHMQKSPISYARSECPAPRSEQRDLSESLSAGGTARIARCRRRRRQDATLPLSFALERTDCRCGPEASQGEHSSKGSEGGHPSISSRGAFAPRSRIGRGAGAFGISTGAGPRRRDRGRCGFAGT